MEKTPLEMFGANLRALRKAKGYSQESFAHHAKLDRAFYGRVERGRQNIALNTIFKIAEALEVEPGDLFAGVISGSVPTSDPGQPPRVR